MFWIHDISLLLKPEIIPIDEMSMDEKLNTLTRFVIFIGIVLSFVLQDARVVAFTLSLILLIIFINNYVEKNNKDTEDFLVANKIDIIDNVVCRRPTKNNPFMNPNLTEVNTEYHKIEATCPSYSSDTEKKINKLYDENMFKNTDDIYDRDTGKRQFYTVPGSRIPNDQSVFANWLYNRGKSCKENNEIQCFQNMYKDLRI